MRERVFTGTYRQAADTFDLRIHDRANRKPIYFRVVPGSTSDKAMFETCLDKIGGRDFTVILNKGFFSEKNIRLMTGMEFIFDLKMKLHIIYVS
ncbi:MAG: hypothetical protein LBD73_02395 [Deferribacteraceae bacterium]|nr:hypothetical protein [Deferribacteraceae bacterium]